MTTRPPLHRADDGTLPAIAWPGGYSIVYFTRDCEILCARCANGHNGSEAAEGHDDKQWDLIGADVLWEGAPESCAHCDAECPTEYGDPEEGQ
jgi:hypothetical protein